ncbi:MAG: PAS domain-containing protein [Myxococcota bacterium]
MANATYLASMSNHELDQQPHGVIKLDAEGNIQYYNRWESDMSGVSPQSALGKNFFTRVAPCTNNRLVYGRFKKGVEDGRMDVSFNYTFTYKMRPTNVRIEMCHDSASKANFVVVHKA